MILKCKMCGGDLNPVEGNTTVECEFCGTMQTIANADNEKKANLFNRANRLRMASEFDKAAGVYESIVSEFSEEAEAYWGLCLCAYGIEYVDDPASGRKIPTCHRTLPESVMDSGNFEMACEYADSVARKLYREEAKAIDRLQKDILAIVANEEPYDVFICYKETDDSGNRTVDSVLGQDIYDALTTKGMKVFFARITLEDKLGQQYEPYIYAALHSSKVMLALGTSFDYYDAVWVKNEWSRFIDMASKDKTKTLIPCYKDIDAYDIPKEFRNLQAQDMNKLGWMQDLIRGVVKLCGKEEKKAIPSETVIVQKTIPSELENLIKRGNLALENKQWNEARGFYDKALNLDAECAEAYFGIACVKANCITKEAFIEDGYHNRNIIEFSNARKFSDADLKEWINSKIESIEAKKHHLKTLRERKELLDGRFIPALASQQYDNVFALNTDGTVNAAGHNYFRQCNVSEWREIVSLCADGETACGLRADGTVVVAGGANTYDTSAVSSWNNITAIAPQVGYVYALKADGSVLVAGDINNLHNIGTWKSIVKTINVSFDILGLRADGTVVCTDPSEYPNVSNWRGIVDIVGDPYSNTLFGLRKDGKVVASGRNEYGQCEVEDWNNIVSIRINESGTVVCGIKKDGTVVVVGKDSLRQCDFSEWKDIVDICICNDGNGNDNIYGLKANGTVVAAGSNEHGQCDLGDWNDIVCIATGRYSINIYGLKADGTVVAAGSNRFGQCEVEDWKNIVAIYHCSMIVYGIKADGTIVVAGDVDCGDNYECDISNWKLFNSIDTLEQEIEENKAKMLKRIEKEKEIARQKALEEEKKRRDQKIQELNRNLESARRSEAEAEQNLQNYKSQLANLRGLFTGKKRKELGEQIANTEHRIQKLQAQISSIEKELQELQK